MLASALALSQAVAAVDHGTPTPALVPSAERVSSVDGIDRLQAWMAAKKTNSRRLNLRAEESATPASARQTPASARQPRSLEQVMKAIAENHRSTHEARRIAAESTDASLADERSWQPAYDRPWHAAKEEAVRKLVRKASPTAAGITKRVALPAEVALSQTQTEAGDASEDDSKLAELVKMTELRVLRAAELIDGGGEEEEETEDAAVSFLQFKFETGDEDEKSLKAKSAGGAMKKLKKKLKAKTKIADAHDRIDEMAEAKKKLKKKQKADEKKEAAEERKEHAESRKEEAEQEEEGEDGQAAGAEQAAASDASSERVAARKAEKEDQLQQRQAQKGMQKAQAEARAQQKLDAKDADKQRKEALKASKEALKAAKEAGAEDQDEEDEGSRMAR